MTKINAISKSEAIETVRKAFDFSVDKLPLSGPDSMRTPFYGLFRSDNSQSVGSGSVSARYVPHTSDDVIALAESAAEVFDDEIGVDCHFRDGHYLTLSPSPEYRRSIFNTKDNLFPRVIIKAGYDGEAFRASLGYFRDVCSNLHIVRSVRESSVIIRHTNGLRGKMDELRESFSNLKGSWDRVFETVAQMSERSVNMVDFLNAIYGVPAKDEGRGVTAHQNRTEKIFKRLQSERYRLGLGEIPGDFKVSAWEAFNAVQGYVQHDATRKSEYNNGFDRMILAMEDKVVQKAESLAMAAI